MQQILQSNYSYLISCFFALNTNQCLFIKQQIKVFTYQNMLQEERQILITVKMYLNGNENSMFAVEDGKLAGYINYECCRLSIILRFPFNKIICLTKYR